MATTKKTRSGYKCGKCGGSGHNARTCPESEKTKSSNAKAPPKEAKTPPPEPEAPAEPDTTKSAAPIRLDTTVDIAAAKAESAPVARTPGKFRCPSCSQVGILVLGSLPPDANGNQRKVMRCEYCHNKTPLHEILVWGAHEDDAPKQ